MITAEANTKYYKADNIEFWFSQIQKVSLCHIFFMQNFIEYVAESTYKKIPDY